MNLGEKIYQYRSAKNLSQGDLADMLEVSRQSVSKWENGAATPDLDKIIKLSEIFGVTIDELVKSEEVLSAEEPKTTFEKPKKESAFPPRKIIGTVLFSFSLLITFLLFVIGGLEGALAGILISSPLILCGTICFIFQKNIGLWCAWAVFFAVDMFLRIATGTNSSVVLNFQVLLFYIRGGDFARLLLAFFQLLAISGLILATILRFKKIPLKSKKYPLIFWSAYIVMKIAYAVFAASHLYQKVMNHLLSYSEIWIYSLFSSLYVWLYTGFLVAALVFTIRYFITKKQNKE